MNSTLIFKRYGLAVPHILLPRPGIDLSRWAVIACDQFTQDREYWKNAARFAGSAPSTLNLILPEVYLEDADRAERLAAIRNTMQEYRSGGAVFREPIHGFMYIERKTAWGRIRKGLVAAIDLDAYDWKPDSKALIRATEATIVDRIPPRMEIRRGAPLELPHIMLLVNDPDKILIEALGSRVRNHAPVYETPLEPDAGSIRGWSITHPDDLETVSAAIQSLAEAGTADDGSCFLFAVGDGNHSLATAKAVWEEFRSAHREDAEKGLIDLEHHPARFALVELVNLYDDGLTFEPIHRVLFGTSADAVGTQLAQTLGGKTAQTESAAHLEQLVAEENQTRFGFVSTAGLHILDTPDPALAVSRLQPALDAFLASRPDVKIDYIHGTDEVFRLGKLADTVSILLPPVKKDSFFTTIATGGPLPRKSFSMGEASEKRYYLECRALFD